MSFYITQKGFKLIEFTITYLLIAIAMHITGGVSISGGNAGTKFYFDNYVGTEKLKIIASILWLPLIIVFLFRGGR